MTLSLQFSLSIALAGILSSSLSAQHIGGETTLAYFNAGASTSDELGEEVLGPGDLDGDGIADYVVADLGYDSDRGRVRARSGATGLTIWVVEGEDLNDHFGHAMAAMGDLDGDGVPDIAVSAPYNDSGAWNGGEICTLSGATGSRIWSVGSPTTNRYLGKAMAAADVNGDGYKDAIAGMPDADNGVYIEAGKISAYSGFGGSFLGDQYGTGSDRRLGSSVAGLSDINGDGCDEVVVSAPRRDSGGHTDNGRVSIFSGAVLTGASGTLVLDRVSGGQTGEEFGTSVANAGDVDGDGYDDFLVGAQFYDDSLGNADVGRVSLISGSTFAELASFEDPSPAESTNFGRTVAGGGDVDHDGIPDLLIGAPGWEIGYNNAAGAVSLSPDELLNC